MFAPSPSRCRATLARAFPALALALAAACAPGVAPAGSSTRQATAPSPGRVAPVYPGAEWERVASPESAGWSGAGLDGVQARLAQLPTTAMLAVVGGRVLLEHGDPAAVSYLASVRKSVLSMLFGRYVADGTIGLDRTLAEVGIDDVGGLTNAEKRATVRHLLSARSGVGAGQVVPREWVRESTRPVTRSAEMNPASLRGGPFGYGYLWWVFDRPELGPAYRGGYAGMGAYGQYLVVLPALDLVVAHKTRPGEGRNVSLREFLGVLELLVGARCPGACPAGGALSPVPRAAPPAAAPPSPAGARRSPAWRAPRRTGAPPRTAPAATESGR
jgi:CubicO group peptidase (beta-lactamase class C family)